MSRDPALLHPELRARWETLAKECLDRLGVVLVLTQGVRTFAEQDALYAQGRDVPGKVVTNARGGDSLHNYGRAFDVAFRRPDGSVTWDGPWAKVGAIGEACGLTWGGRWRRFPDRPHFEWTSDGATLRTLKAARAAEENAHG